VISRTRDGGTGCPGCRFDDQLQRRRDRGKLRPVDRALLAIKDEVSTGKRSEGLVRDSERVS
jgi:hypothetical protein